MTIAPDAGRDVESAVRLYLRENPEMLVALDQGVVNLSKLATRIITFRPGLNHISVRAALNRVKERKESRTIKTGADDLLRKSKISLQDKISVVKSDGPLALKHISATFLENSVVYIIDEMIQKIPPSLSGISTEKLFAGGINILQLISCSNETILILNKEVCVRAYEILSRA